MELTKAVQGAINPGTNPPKANYSFVDDLKTRREAWEGSIYKQSTDILYEQLLTPAYSKYVEMTKNDTNALIVRKELEDFININNLSFKASTHTLVKLVRCIFGDVDRRRVSTYGVTLRAAFAAKKDPKDLADFIRKNGGVQEIKLSNKKAMSAKDKAEVLGKILDQEVLAEVHSEAIFKEVDAAAAGQRVVFVATQKANGNFTINLVTSSTTAVNHAIAACFASKQALLVKKAAEELQKTTDTNLKTAISKAVH